jgi:hypothetical protein
VSHTAFSVRFSRSLCYTHILVGLSKKSRTETRNARRNPELVIQVEPVKLSQQSAHICR